MYRHRVKPEAAEGACSAFATGGSTESPPHQASDSPAPCLHLVPNWWHRVKCSPTALFPRRPCPFGLPSLNKDKQFSFWPSER